MRGGTGEGVCVRGIRGKCLIAQDLLLTLEVKKLMKSPPQAFGVH